MRLPSKFLIPTSKLLRSRVNLLSSASSVVKRRFLASTFAMLLVASGLLAAQTARGAEQDIREAVRKYIAGYASNTVDGYFDHYAPDVTMWWPNGLRQEREVVAPAAMWRAPPGKEQRPV